MSQENVAAIVRLVEARNAGDRETVFEYIDQDAEWRTTGLLVGQAGTYRGCEEIMRYFEFLDSEFDDLRFEVKHVMESGDLVVADVYVSGVGKQSNAPVEVHYAVMSRWRNGKILNAHNLMTRHEALEAAGLSE